MEDFAYDYAISKGYKPTRYFNQTTGELLKKIPMKDLFDMMSGTSTGSILTTGLSVQSKQKDVPLYWGKDCVKIYIDGGPMIFQQNKLGRSFQYLCYIGFVILFTSLFYCWGRSRYDSKKKQMALKEMHDFLLE